MKRLIAASLAGLLLAMPLAAQDTVDLEMMKKIRDEGYKNSQIMKTLGHLTDNIGARLSGSPQKREAEIWTRDKMTSWGLENAHLESFEFGRGWDAAGTTVVMTAPRTVQLGAVPVAWHPGTDGIIEGEVIRADINSSADFDKYRGKLAGKIVALRAEGKVDVVDEETFKNVFSRHDEESLERAKMYRTPRVAGAARSSADNVKRRRTRGESSKAVWQFLKEEGAIATMIPTRSYGGIMRTFGSSPRPGYTATLPQVAIAAENYNRMLRYLKNGEVVSVKMDVKATFYDETTKENNVIAEIKGKGRNPEIVMAGAHLDSWHLGDGAVDNGTGVAVVMEAMRILKALNVKPNRTIRVALWGAEEQGLHGSTAYIQRHFVDYPELPAVEGNYVVPHQRKNGDADKILKDEFEKFSVYFNFDNGSGKIRGINTHNNLAASAIFENWFTPFHDLDAKTVSQNGSGGSDHASFQRAGLPGYQFMVDRLDYFVRTWHTQLDVIDNAHEADLRQSAVILAAFLYNAAMREDRMPR